MECMINPALCTQASSFDSRSNNESVFHAEDQTLQGGKQLWQSDL